jgi:alpha-tubulin suppressor-like RCC1 family protein
MPGITTTNFRDSDGVDLGRKLVTKDYLLEVYGTILENSPASGLVVTPELWGWGDNNSGQLGINLGVFTPRNTPVTTFAGGTNWKQVSCGNKHSAAIKTDGTLWTWGGNGSGELGDNTTTDRSTPVTTFAGGTDWKSVSVDREYTAAIKTDGSLWVWGRNDGGQLGTNDATNRTTPVTTFAGGNTWKSVDCGYYHTAAIKTDGSLWVWGTNIGNILGIGGGFNLKSTPITTFAGGNNWKQVSCGRDGISAIKTDGSLWIWGYNERGQLGTNNITNIATPVTTFAGGNNWKQVSCGTNYTAAIKTDGSLWTWGFGEDGRLGNFATTNRSTPVTTFAGGNNWKQVAGRSSHTAAIKTDGSLWTWGTGGSGRLGTNDSTNRSTPVTTFAGGNNWKSASAGGDFTVAIQTIDYI